MPTLTYGDPNGVGTDSWTKSAATAATCLDDGVCDLANARPAGDGAYITLTVA